MLTFILLVVLGGGVGLLVVSLAESGKPTADGPPTPRADAEPEPAPETDHEPGSGGHPIPPVGADALQNEVPAEPEPAWELVPVGGGATEDEAPPPRRRRAGERVPKSQVAVEGRFADVARVPIWRRMVALVGIVAISVLGGVLVAAVLGAAIGAAAELLNQAIG